MRSRTIPAEAKRELTEGKYVVRADGTARVFERTGIHAYNACGCPEPDCKGRAVSAGFFEVKDGVVRTFGESGTLGLKSRPEDAEIIKPLL